MTTAAVAATTAEGATTAAGAEHAEKIIDPIHQFLITPLFGDGPLGLFTFTNSALWAVIAVACAALLFLLAPTKMVPTRLQSIAESLYEVVDNMTQEVLHENARRYFPFILTLFLFILFANVLGLVP